ncbi:MAG: ATP-binding protein [Defluviitaleaceae bacterium]|nr:ATP-binding protein [Defluviitaleaceae bacterium]
MIFSILSGMIDKRIAAYQQRLTLTHFNEVENMYNQMRGWIHDYSNHMQVLKGHAKNEDMQAVIQYLNDIDDDLHTVTPLIRTGNKMCDAILNSKIALARAKDITVMAEANIAVELTISQLDLCIIIGNLMDNAIEASLALPKAERLIRIYMEMKGTQLYMSFTNFTARGKQAKMGGRFLTTKFNSDGHGFGLVRMDNIIKRYSGYINRNSEDGAFSTEIMLPQ